MPDPPSRDPLKDIRNARLPSLLLDHNCRVHFIDSLEAPLQLHIDQAGMDYLAGHDQADKRYAIPLTAIAYVEQL